MKKSLDIPSRICQAVFSYQFGSIVPGDAKVFYSGHAENRWLVENFHKADIVSVHIEPRTFPMITTIQVTIRFLLDGKMFADIELNFLEDGSVGTHQEGHSGEPQEFDIKSLTAIVR